MPQVPKRHQLNGNLVLLRSIGVSVVTIETQNANEISEQVNSFYSETGRPTKKVDSSDRVIVAMLDEKMWKHRSFYNRGWRNL